MKLHWPETKRTISRSKWATWDFDELAIDLADNSFRPCPRCKDVSCEKDKEGLHRCERCGLRF